MAIVDGKIDGERSSVAVQFFGKPTLVASVTKKEEAVQSEPAPVAQDKLPEVLSADNENSQTVQDVEIVETVQNVQVVQNKSYVNEQSQLSTGKFLDMSIVFVATALGIIFILNMIIIISESAIHFSKMGKKTEKAEFLS